MSTPSEPIDRHGAWVGFGGSVALIGAILFVEKFLLNFFVDFEAAQESTGFAAWVRGAQHWGFRFAVTLGASLAVFAWIRGPASLRQVNTFARAQPLRAPLLLLHFALALPLVPLSHLLYGSQSALPFPLIVVLWTALALAATVALGLAFAPWQLWRTAAGALGMIWAYALCAAALAASTMEWTQRLWEPTASVTFNLVRLVLAPVLHTLRSDPANLILYTDNFAIQVADICSGLEGVGLMLAFCGAWLIYCRRELVFPRVLLLIPLGLVLIFALNVLRIAVLMLIGNAGLTDLAVYGFHSQAGWIAFNCAACGIAIVSRRSAWLQRPTGRPVAASTHNATAAYLVPFLIVLGGGMIVLATSGSSGPWYALPALAGALALWHYRRDFAALDWRCSWRGVAVGVGVFLLWMLTARWLRPDDAARWTPAAAVPPWNTSWLLARIFGSVLVIPIVEELAYRGYLLRRLAARDFAAMRFEAVGPWPLFISAAVFGVAHGAMWPAGVIAGLAYGILVIHSGRIGEAVYAHATTNALIAMAVLFWNRWELW